MSCFDLTHGPVATASCAAATGVVSMSTRPDPEGSGMVEIVTQRCPRLRVVWELRELLPTRFGPVTVHPTRWGVGPQAGLHDTSRVENIKDINMVKKYTNTHYIYDQADTRVAHRRTQGYA